MVKTSRVRWTCLLLWLGAGTQLWGQLVWHWSNPMPHGNDVVAMACYKGLTIEAADAGQLYTSDDLQLWLPSATSTTNTLQAITVFGNRVIVTGANGTVLYSDDGVDYTYTNLGTADWLVAAAVSPSLVVAVGDEAAIYTSSNGSNWTRQAAPPGVGGNWLRGVAYGGGTFVTVGEGGYIATSADGTNWSESTLAGFTKNLNYVAWLNTPGSSNGFGSAGFLAVSDLGAVIISTNNGTSWSLQDSFLTTNSLYGISGNNDSRVLAGDTLLYLAGGGSNGMAWSNQIGILPGAAPAWTYFCSLWETNLTNQYLVAGDSGMMITGMESNGNYNWYQPEDSIRSWLWQMTTNAGLYVAVGDQAVIMTSDNGVDWTTEAIPYTNGISASNTVFFGVGGSTNQLIAVGNGGTIVLSTNQLITVVTTNSDGSLSTNTVSTIGVIWNPIPPPTTNDLHGVAYFENQYFVSGGNGTILESPDGLNWTQRTTPTTAFISGLAPFPGGMVAVGDLGTILSSPDGINWTARSSGVTNWIFRVRYLDGTLIAVGENGTILTSTNGTSWTKRASGTTEWLNDVTMVTNNFYIAGNSATVLCSTNAATWTNVNNVITSKSLYGAATQGGQLVVVGVDGVILQSQVVPVLTPVNLLGFGYTTNEVVFLAGGQVDQQFTLDSSTNFMNWTTGPLFDLTSGDGTLIFFETLPTNAPQNQYYRTTLVVPQ